MRTETTLPELFARYADRPALLRRDAATETVTATTYAELWERAGSIAAWLEAGGDLGVVAGGHTGVVAGVVAGDRIAVLAPPSVDSVAFDLACTRLGAVCVPLQASAPVAQLASIVDETEPVAIGVAARQFDAAVELAATSDRPLRIVVLDGDATDGTAGTATDGGPRTAATPLDEVVRRGAALPAPTTYAPEPGEDPLALLLYTSGSTGTPKGAMYTHRMVQRLWHALDAGDDETVGFAYLPMSHLAGRAALLSALGRGGAVGFVTEPDLSTLFEDLRAYAPTELLLVPRVAEMVRQEADRVARRLPSTDDGTTGDGRTTADDAVRRHVREVSLGGRVRHAMCASAPITAELRAFIESCLGTPLHDMYGSTEAGSVLHDGVVQQPPVTEYRLEDVPELGYGVHDEPYPRGELLIKSDGLIPGYYRRPDVTASVFTEDGFYRTGDVMAQTGPDRFEYLDRRNNVVKLAQGEFVAVAALEAAFGGSQDVRQIAVHGDGRHAFVLAVVVPTDPDATEQSVLAALQTVGRQAGLAPYEIPRGVIVEREPFTVENGMLSDAVKLLRPRFTARYGDRLAQLADRLAEQEGAALADEVRAAAADRARAAAAAASGRTDTAASADTDATLATVVDAARRMLGAAVPDDTARRARFSDLGGDSLSAFAFSRLLGEVFETEVPVGVVTDPTNDLTAIAAHIDRRDDGRPSVARVHGTGATVLRATDLTLDALLGDDTATPTHATNATPPATPAPHHPPRTVLLTGANGFLGRFMCIDWLERLAPAGGTLVCVVRGADDAAARERLRDAFRADPAFADRFAALEHAVEVVAGDVAEHRLGLEDARWADLTGRIDLVSHAAALVNHVLPYDALFGPNVVGTAEVVRLALAAGGVPVTFVSSVAVGGTSGPEVLDESADVRTAIPEWPLADDYANGYGASKWASEVLLREAHDRHGLPVRVFRSDMVLAHTRWRGQVNLPDVFTRLLWSVLATGVAPRSFTELDPSGAVQRSHYDGLPADFTAAAIDVIGADATSDARTVNVVNPHDDGVSLDTFVRWLREDGHAIEIVDDHADWVERFRTALEALPDADRARSVLPLLHAFEHPAPPAHGSPIPATAFADAVRATAPLGAPVIPTLDRALIAKFADDLAYLGLLEPAGAAAA